MSSKKFTQSEDLNKTGSEEISSLSLKITSKKKKRKAKRKISDQWSPQQAGIFEQKLKIKMQKARECRKKSLKKGRKSKSPKEIQIKSPKQLQSESPKQYFSQFPNEIFIVAGSVPALGQKRKQLRQKYDNLMQRNVTSWPIAQLPYKINNELKRLLS